ncbi:NAD(P)-dependent oxidoreductase [Polynucleobacter sp. es-EL-1]|uniref:NAD-dependent epimerase/dehydratase family protein n=1 Tax=Polynucleobacter sp. es-EL-1 TaxID=1855652 RepID=UPI001BFEEBD8|nr:NAD(P)-dependent oxidoreductase [Polynucleobacter sp. es-EL-1]QWE10881.1 NAD(P)-dependent oxidoreductase [Polynucleobacter sp. es-EL-1]
MRVFLTGASGFVGSFFLRNLLSSSEYEVSVLLRKPRDAWRIQDLLPKVQVIVGELDRLEIIEAELFDFRPNAFVHLAWNGVLGGDRNSPSQWRNVISTMELVELANRLSVNTFIGLGSQAEYGPCQHKIDESCQTKPTTLYGVSKLAAQLLSERLCAEYGIRHAWLRLFSSFGPTDNPEWLIPYLTKCLIEKEKSKLTAAEQMWDYIYVEDVASAIRSVLDAADAEGVFNLGSGKAYMLKTIIEKIRDLIDPKLPLGFGEVQYRPDQVMHLQADISRLNNATGWLPKFELDQAIEETVAWHKKGAS